MRRRRARSPLPRPFVRVDCIRAPSVGVVAARRTRSGRSGWKLEAAPAARSRAGGGTPGGRSPVFLWESSLPDLSFRGRKRGFFTADAKRPHRRRQGRKIDPNGLSPFLAMDNVIHYSDAGWNSTPLQARTNGMICSFADEGTEDIYDGDDTKAARRRCPQ